MKEEIKRDISSILKEAAIAIRKKDIKKLKEISDHTIHDASIFQDNYSTPIAVVTYSLSKIFEKNNYKQYGNWNEFCARCIKHLEKARRYMETNQIGRYNGEIKNLYRMISQIEKEAGAFLTEVINQAQIKKGSKIYEHGISMGRTAELLGISSWELMSYVGQTKISDEMLETKPVKERLETARKLFS